MEKTTLDELLAHVRQKPLVALDTKVDIEWWLQKLVLLAKKLEEENHAQASAARAVFEELTRADEVTVIRRGVTDDMSYCLHLDGVFCPNCTTTGPSRPPDWGKLIGSPGEEISRLRIRVNKLEEALRVLNEDVIKQAGGLVRCDDLGEDVSEEQYELIGDRLKLRATELRKAIDRAHAVLKEMP